MTLNGVMAITLRYFSEFGKPVLQETMCGVIYARVYCIFTACTISYKESSRSLSHLLMSFLLRLPGGGAFNVMGPHVHVHTVHIGKSSPGFLWFHSVEIISRLTTTIQPPEATTSATSDSLYERSDF